MRMLKKGVLISISLLFIYTYSVSCSNEQHKEKKQVEKVRSEKPFSPEELAKVVKKSTVVVKCYCKESKFFGLSKKAYSVLGSGFFINYANGQYVVLTNMHVLGFEKLIYSEKHSVPKFSEYKVFISPYDRRDSIPVTRIFINKSLKDIAVLIVDGKIGDYPVLILSNEYPKVGEKVFAMGHPYSLEFSFTEGIVSNVLKIPEFKGTYIQTDAAINPGNSGGPLMDEFGRVVGMNTWGIRKNISEGLNFAISSPEILKEVDDWNFVLLPTKPKEISKFLRNLFK